jgi:hypothetical protein
MASRVTRICLILVVAHFSIGCSATGALDAGAFVFDGGKHDAGATSITDGSIADASTIDASADSGAAIDSGASDASADAGGTVDAGALVDLDFDGIGDALEFQWAQMALPALYLHADEQCPRAGIVFRATRHSFDVNLVHIVYVTLFERDCGLSGHVGDDEVFSVTFNPANQKITALKAISHQGTLCQRVSSCGTCSGLTACADATPRLYFSKNKHGSYAALSACGSLTCLDSCGAGTTLNPPMVNAGEPSHHLTENLTQSGLISTDAGWSEMTLFDFNPWSASKFGGAGIVADDLIDTAFDTPNCQ